MFIINAMKHLSRDCYIKYIFYLCFYSLLSFCSNLLFKCSATLPGSQRLFSSIWCFMSINTLIILKSTSNNVHTQTINSLVRFSLLFTHPIPFNSYKYPFWIIQHQTPQCRYQAILYFIIIFATERIFAVIADRYVCFNFTDFFSGGVRGYASDVFLFARFTDKPCGDSSERRLSLPLFRIGTPGRHHTSESSISYRFPRSRRFFKKFLI